MSKSECLARIAKLQQNLDHILQSIEQTKARLDNLRADYGPKIEALQQRADPIAALMRDAFRRSQEAYQARDGETAKILSLEGKDYRARCEPLNAQANAMREGLKREFENLQGQLEKAAVIRAELKSAQDELKSYRQTPLRNFDNSHALRKHDFEAWLDKWPQKLFQYIETIEYNPQLHKENKLGVSQLRDGKYVVQVSENPLEYAEDQAQSMRDTFAHEAGHIIYRMVLTREEKTLWSEAFNREFNEGKIDFDSGIQEDFADAFLGYLKGSTGISGWRLEIIESAWIRLWT